MTRPFPLAVAQQVAERDAATAGAALAQHGARCDAARAKADELCRFRDEYFAQRAQTLALGVAAARVRDFDQFIARIGAAIDAQLAEIARLDAMRAQALSRWQRSERKRKAFEALAARHAGVEAQREARLDRKTEDEFAARVRRD
jgi:flagellar FliJ protein